MAGGEEEEEEIKIVGSVVRSSVNRKWKQRKLGAAAGFAEC
jgi:hypothetical protein